MARCGDGSLYTGIAKDVPARLAAHNSGRGAAYTRSRLPVKLVYTEKGFTRSTALSREARIKALERPSKLALLKAARAVAVLLLLCAGLAHATPTFNKENPVALSSAAPQAFTFSAPAASFTYPIRMYFIRQSSGTEVGSATSPDGLAWTEDPAAGRLSTNTLPSVSASSITGCGVLPLTGGGYRMVYSIVSTTGSYRVHSATSADGLSWANDAGTVVNNGLASLSDPKLVQLNDASWMMYYVADSEIFSARSTNQGLSWSAPSLVLSTMAVDVGASVLTNGYVRLYLSEPLPGSTTATTVISALSTDANGTSFSVEGGFRVSTDAASGSLSFPVPVRSTDTFRWRLYYDFAGPGTVSTADVHTALTGAPAPAAMTPNRVLNSQTTVFFTISGDIFSPTPTASLGGQPLALTRVDDQTLTTTFNVMNQASGFYTLTVTNADGNATTLPNALFIDYPAGSVTLVNNLLRPRTGTSTAITITTFSAGRLTARLFTIDGRSVRTLLDGQQPQGVLNLAWDGRDGGGTSVASGLYLLHVTGPKIDMKAKIIVIR
jgi:putative endonuclease